jgi:hypothetical protein
MTMQQMRKAKARRKISKALSGANVPDPPTCPRAIDYAAHISQEFFNQMTRYCALRKMLQHQFALAPSAISPSSL